jgi:hypothetical protein
VEPTFIAPPKHLHPSISQPKYSITPEGFEKQDQLVSDLNPYYISQKVGPKEIKNKRTADACHTLYVQVCSHEQRTLAW